MPTGIQFAFCQAHSAQRFVLHCRREMPMATR